MTQEHQCMRVHASACECMQQQQNPTSERSVLSPTCIVCCAAVVGGREEGDEVALRKALKAVHDALVRPHYHLQVVGLHSTTAHTHELRHMT